MKKVVGQVKLQIKAGQANPAPPIGPALGSRGVNIMEFCKQFNARTQKDQGMVIPVVITVFSDRSFTFITKTPPAPVLIREAAKLEKGSQTPGKSIAGTLTDEQVTAIANIKLPDLNTDDIDAAKQQIVGTARSMGIRVQG